MGRDSEADYDEIVIKLRDEDAVRPPIGIYIQEVLK
jgi:hypothetical protein